MRTLPVRASASRLATALALAVATAVTFAACASAGPTTESSATPNSGIWGVALAGPQCPVEVEGSPCPPKPISTRIVVQDSAGRTVTTFVTAADGTFRVALAAGRYTLLTTNQVPPLLKPTEVTVTAGEYTKIDLDVDTGIR